LKMDTRSSLDLGDKVGGLDIALFS
jgi:hypothetical protein